MRKIPEIYRALRRVAVAAWLCALCACVGMSEDGGCTYEVGSGGDTVEVRLADWHVTGPFTLAQDSLWWRDYMADPLRSTLEANPDTVVRLWHNGPYHPKYGSPDLCEVFGIGVGDTTRMLDTLVTYLSCTLRAGAERNVFMCVAQEMDCAAFLNGDSLRQTAVGTMEAYPLHLRAGDNTLFVKARGCRRRYYYEAELLDSAAFASLYARQHTGNIVEPIIVGDTVTLTEAHANITGGPVRLSFSDANGREACAVLLRKDSLRYAVAGLVRGHAYICSMAMAGDTVRQPVMTWGSLEEAEARFKALRDSLPDGHPRTEEIDQLLYRVWKLGTVTGAMREDKWFTFKLPWVIYQLEHAFAHLDGTYGNDAGEYNLKFLTYRSRLDGCPQRYILVTPNHVDRNRKYPLVVVVRPNGEKRHHLFACPQIAHQYVVNDMQAAANEYGVFCIMPEARMLRNEDLMPFAEAELKLALADVQEHYNIDADRIYLMASCSGAYRALRLACQNPGLFAAMALYAPVYRRSDAENIYAEWPPEAMVGNLRGLPVLVYGDPADTHSPLRGYAPLLDDMRDADVELTLTLRRNTAHGANGYHRMVLGRDALGFFAGKRRKPFRGGCYRMPPQCATVADFYSRPFIYVYNAADTTAVYRRLVDDIRAEYEGYLYSRLPLDTAKDVRMPLVPDTRVTRRMLENHNVFLIGGDFCCPCVKAFAREVAAGRPRVKPGEVTLTACSNPYNAGGMILLYTSGSGPHFRHVINFPWMHGFRKEMMEVDL